MQYRITKTQFSVFCREVRKWQNFFGLQDWAIDIEFDGGASERRHRADIWFNCCGRVATITLGTKWNTLPTIAEIRKCAFHEVCELMFGKINDMLSRKLCYNDDDREQEIHVIIRTLENTVFK